MGQSMMAQRQQNDLDVHGLEAGRPRLGADKERLRFVRDAMKNRLEFAAVGVEPKVEKGTIRNGKPRFSSKSSTNVSASTPRIAPGSTSLRSGALRAPRNRFQYA